MRISLHLGRMLHGTLYYFLMFKNLLDVNGCLKKILVQMATLKITRQEWLQNDIPKLREENLVIFFS
jgi:hypothetical protein